MKPNRIDEVITFGQAEEVIDMTIDQASEAIVMRTMTDLYSNPILACIREISTNARDSHVFAGQERPIEVRLPTRENMNFEIQDWGLGMSRDDIVQVYSRYGASTGRESNEVAGMWGLGSKAPMTYVNSFRVEAIKDGVRILAVVGMSDDGIPRIRILHTGDTELPNGVKITIPCKSEADLSQWANEAVNFYKFWRAPVLVDGEAPKKFYDLESGWIQVEDDIWVNLKPSNDRWNASAYFVQAEVPYPVTVTQIAGEYYNVRPTDHFVCYIPTGHLDFTPSREAVAFTGATKDAIATARTVARDQFDRMVKTMGEGLNDWERFKLSFKLPKSKDALRQWGVDPSYGDGYHAWIARYDGVSRVGSKWSDSLHAFTEGTMAAAEDHTKGEDADDADRYRFVRNFDPKRVSKRHLKSLYAHTVGWEGKDIVFLPVTTRFNTDDFPGVDWKTVPLLKGESKPRRKAHREPFRAIWPINDGYNTRDLDTYDLPDDVTIVWSRGNYPLREILMNQYPDHVFVHGVTTDKQAARFMREYPDAVTQQAWIEKERKVWKRSLKKAEKAWESAPRELRLLTIKLSPYIDSITAPSVRKALLRQPDEATLNVAKALGCNIHDDKLADQTRQTFNALLEEFPALRLMCERSGMIKEAVIYVNAKSRQRKAIRPDSTKLINA